MITYQGQDRERKEKKRREMGRSQRKVAEEGIFKF